MLTIRQPSKDLPSPIILWFFDEGSWTESTLPHVDESQHGEGKTDERRGLVDTGGRAVEGGFVLNPGGEFGFLQS